MDGNRLLMSRHTGGDSAPMRRLSEITFQIRISCESFGALLWTVEPHSVPCGMRCAHDYLRAMGNKMTAA
jgi:hypothetical protein